ncbi:Uncharacterized protein TSPI_07445 [Trichinella spiralis]|uniref:Uncharacterized protein n=1 Tax=Trichinella spiralis TaxID=6334 RepID=A0ABR3K4P7_TRISP
MAKPNAALHLHKAYSSCHIKAIDSSLTAVGGFLRTADSVTDAVSSAKLKSINENLPYGLFCTVPQITGEIK